MPEPLDAAPVVMPVDLRVQLGRLTIANPILVASGTFGYAREIEALVDLGQLGGIIPKTITKLPRRGNSPWRTIETPAGMLNSIGLDNDGIDEFIAHHLPYLGRLQTAIIVSIAGRTHEEFVEMAGQLSPHSAIAASSTSPAPT
jgi:dihydroorotate dehydrogenase (NAD+) catalytic subunit